MKNSISIFSSLLMLTGALLSDCSYAAKPNKIVLIADPRVLAIKIIDSKDRMVDLVKQKDICYGESPEVPNNTDYTKMRKTVYQKLKQAQAQLPKGLHFCIYEGYRSLQLQKQLFDTRFEKTQKQHPKWSKDKVFTETTKIVSPVINLDGSKNVPPHSTGGAIDIYLVDDQGKPVDMGIHPKDCCKSDRDEVIALTASPIISAEAKKNREIMNAALLAADFVNYGTEYWHWSYGDRYWAYHKNKPHAIYGSYQEEKAK